MRLLAPIGWENKDTGLDMCPACAETYLRGSRTAYKSQITKIFCTPEAIAVTPKLAGTWQAESDNIYEVGVPRYCDFCHELNPGYLVICAKSILDRMEDGKCHCYGCDPSIYPPLS